MNAIFISLLVSGFVAFFFGKIRNETWWKHIFGILGFAFFLGSVAFGLGALVWMLSEAIGFLPYSDRPGPGWHLKPGFPPLADCGVAVGWAFFGIIISFPHLIALSSLRKCAEKYQPKRLFRVPVEALLDGFILLILGDSAGWYQAVNPLLVYAVGAGAFSTGLFSGLGLNFIGPNFRKILWSLLALALLGSAGGAINQIIQGRVNARMVQVSTIAWERSSNEEPNFAQDPILFFDPQDPADLKKMLSDLKLKGRFKMLGGGGTGAGGSKKIKCFLLISDIPPQGLKLPIPDVDRAVFYQGSDRQWHTWPEKAPLTQEKLDLDYDATQDSLSVWVDNWDGSRSASPISDFKKQLRDLK